ncbi:putative type IX secretion system sortase PorU2 [Spirosoma litoris]
MANLFDFLSRIAQVIKPLVYVLSLLVFRPAIAQTEKGDPDPTRWIVYTQTYYKISVTEDGLYRLTKADLQQAGLAVGQLDPTTIQLFHRGIEQAIFIAGETDKRFDTNDFIEFYGRKNDGAQDSLLYRINELSQRRVQPHAYYSLFSDTSAYFLTWRLDGKPGKRMAAYTDTAYSHLTAEPYHWKEELRIFTDTYPAGTIYPLGASYENGAILTNYDTGEGWTGPLIKATDRYDQTFSLTKFKSVSDQNGNPIKPILSYLLVGRNAGVHRVSCLAGSSTTTLRALGQASFGDYETAQFEADWRVTDLDPSGNLIVSIQPQETGEEVSVSYVRIQYPQRTDLAGMEQKVLRLRPNAEGRSFLDLTSAPSGTRLFDISDLNNPVRVQGNWVNDHWQGVIQNAQTNRLLLATSQPKTVLSLKPVSFRQIDPSKPNFLIITHPLLRKPTATEADPVRAYATYRASDAGGQYDTLTLNIDQLFDQFSYGERHPLAIRRFADYMLRGSSRPQFLFLIGQSRDPQSVRKLPDASLLDLIPNAGWPGSDIGLVEGLNGESANVPAMPIGRLNTASPQNVLDYLNKVKEHENTAEPALWRKNVLHLSGGRNRYELLEFRSFVDEFKSVIEAPFAGGRVTTLSKQTDNLVETIPVSEIINQGVGLITLFGHSSLDVADIDIGFVSNDILGYRNKGRYPFLLVNGCAAGNTFFGRPTFGTDWVLTPNRGAILFLAHTYNGFATPLKSYSDKLYEVLSDSQFVAQSIGLVQQETIRRYLKTNNSIFDITTAQQMTLQGDPAVRLFPYSSPDFAFATGSLHLRNSQGDSLTTQSDSVRISVVIVNYGRVTASPIAVRIRQYEANGHLLNERFFTEKSPFYADTLSWLIPNRHATTLPSYFELVLDPENQIAERNELNNSVEISTDGSANGLPFSIDSTPPLLEVAFDGKRIADGDFVSARPVIDVLVQDENRRLLRTDTTGVDLYLQHPCSAGGCPYERLMFSSSETHWATADSTNAFRLSYQPRKPLAAGLYTFVATGSDLSGNRAAPYRIHFSVKNQGELIGAGAYPTHLSTKSDLSFR